MRTKQPDGKPDHHIRLSGLGHPISHIEIKAGTDQDQPFKWSDRAGEESPENPLGKWWIINTVPDFRVYENGELDIWFSVPDRSRPHTSFRVFVFYDETNFDRIVPAVSTPEPELDAETIEAKPAKF